MKDAIASGIKSDKRSAAALGRRRELAEEMRAKGYKRK